MSLIGGFVPAVLHDPGQRRATLADARSTAELFAAAGATMFVTAVGGRSRLVAAIRAVARRSGTTSSGCSASSTSCAPSTGSPRRCIRTSARSWRRPPTSPRCSKPPTSRWCLDTGHLFIGGYDPAKFAVDAGERVVHAHLKDVRGEVAARVCGGELSIQEGVGAGLFCPLGQGEAPIHATVNALEAAGYTGWYVLEQDTDLGAAEPPPGTGPVEAARASLDYLSR